MGKRLANIFEIHGACWEKIMSGGVAKQGLYM